MTALSRRERAALCELMDVVGPDAATLCEGWSTYDLAAHLVLREGSPLAAAGIMVPALEKVADRGMKRLQARASYAEVVERVRQGPPRLSPLRPARVERQANTIEYFIHHEDVRRAQPGWEHRELDRRDQDALWARIALVGRLAAKGAPVGVELARSDVAGVRRIKQGEPTLVVRGLPGELVLFAAGRGAQADVELDGDPEAREAFGHRQLGL